MKQTQGCQFWWLSVLFSFKVQRKIWIINKSEFALVWTWNQLTSRSEASMFTKSSGFELNSAPTQKINCSIENQKTFKQTSISVERMWLLIAIIKIRLAASSWFDDVIVSPVKCVTSINYNFSQRREKSHLMFSFVDVKSEVSIVLCDPNASNDNGSWTERS